MRRAWLSSVALVAVFGVAACGDDDDDVGTPMAGSAGKDMGGAPGDGGAPSGGNPTAGKAGMGGKGGMGGNAGKGGMAVGGDDQGMAGEGGAPSAGGAAGGAGGDGGAVISLADEVRSKLAGTSPLPAVPADTTNAFADNAGAATLGQALFFDEKFSGAMTADNDLGTTGQLNKVSCASCHDGKVLDDTRSSPATVSKGTGTHTRNSPAVVNSAFYTWTNWGGRFSAQWELPLVVVENGAIMNGTRLQVAHRLYSAYKAQYEAVFGAFPADISNETRFPATGKPTQATFDNMTADDKTIVNRILVNYSKALQAYMRKLVSREAPFDAFMAGDDDALTEAQLEGARSFVDRGCTTCHNGATFSDQIFHDLGVPQTGDNVPATDDGRFANMPALVATTNIFSRNGDFSDDKNTGKLASIPVPPAEVPADWKGQFRTPSLRGVASSAPYMHSGQLATLSDVLDFYAAGGTATTATGQLTGFTFQAGEKEKMIDFLGTLSGKDIAESLLTDTSAP